MFPVSPTRKGLLLQRTRSAVGQLPRGRFQLDRSNPLGRGLIGLWPLAGNGLDYSTANRNGTPTGGPTFTPGFGGLTLTFNGATQCINTAATVGPQSAGSWSLWLYPTNIASGVQLFVSQYSFALTQAYMQLFSLTTGQLFGRVQGAGLDASYVSRSTNTGAVANNSWYHVAMTWSGGTTDASVALYVNGSRADTTNAGAGSFSGPNTSAIPLIIGAQAGSAPPTEVFSGRIAAVAEWNRAISGAEVLRLYSEPYGLLVPARRRSYVGVATGPITIAIAEAGSAADAVALTGTFAATIAEAGTAADTVALTGAFAASIAEAGTAADTVATTARVTVAEAGTAVDTVALTGAFAASIAEAGAAADTVAATARVSVAETGAAVDTVALTGTLAASVAEAGSATDTVALNAATFAASVSEAGAAVDTITATPSGTIAVSVSESGAAADTIALNASTFAISISEAGAAVDTVAASAVVAIAEAGTAADTVSGAGLAAVSESGTATDTVALNAAQFIVAIQESAIAIDAFTFGDQPPPPPPPPPIVPQSGGFDAGPAYGGWFNLAFNTGARHRKRRKRTNDIGRELEMLAYADAAEDVREALPDHVARSTDEIAEQAVAALRRSPEVRDDAAALRRVAAHEAAFARALDRSREEARQAFIATLVERATREYVAEQAEARRRFIAREDSDLMVLGEMM